MPSPAPQPGTSHALATLKRLTAIHAQTCALDRRKSVEECWKDGDIKPIGEEWPGGGVRRPLGQCRYCFELYPLDVFDTEGDAD